MKNLYIHRNSKIISVLRKWLVIVLFIAGLNGCATDAPKTPDYFATDIGLHAPKINRIALVTDLAPPEIDSVNLGFTRSEGAAGGLAGGATTGALLALNLAAEGTATGMAAGAAGAAIALLLPVFVVGGAIIGTMSGVDAGYPADMLAEAEANAQNILNSAYLQTELLEHVQDYAIDNTDYQFIRMPKFDPETLSDKPDYKMLSDESIDAVLEVELLRFSLEYYLEVEVRARLISTQTGTVLSDGHYKFLSEPRRLEQWIANGATPLTGAIQRGLQRIAEDIIDEKFLLFYPNEPKHEISQQADKESDEIDDETVVLQYGEDDFVPHYVLSPIYPQLDMCFFCKGHPDRAIGNLEFVAVDSIQPTLQWESFPRDYDVINIDGLSQQITDVRYELRIYIAGKPAHSFYRGLIGVPTQLIYDVRDIYSPYHKIEGVLDACKRYFWTVRARFKLDGRNRVTEWAGAFDVASWSSRPWNLRKGIVEYKMGMMPDGPEWFYYPFSTPCTSE